MATFPLRLHPSLESSSSVGEPTARQSLFDSKDDFIERIAPVGVAAIYFGTLSFARPDAPLSRQALFKLSFLYRHFLHPGGLRVIVTRQVVVFSGFVKNRSLVTLGDILARQIPGILEVQDTTQPEPSSTIPLPGAREGETTRDNVQFLFATDQTLRSGVHASHAGATLTLEGAVSSSAQKSWAEQLAQATGAQVDSRLTVSEDEAFPQPENAEPPAVDDESLQALILFRLRLARETEHVPLRVKASSGIVTIQGRVRTEALRQRVENIARSTLGLRELRSMISLQV